MSYTLEIDGWKNNIRFSSAHIIFDHDKCGFLHGHTYAIHLKIHGEKDEDGFIVDFSIVKMALKQIADTLDHRILIPEKNDYITVSENEIKINYNNKKYILPAIDCMVLPINSTTVENIAEYLLEKFLNKIKISKNIKIIQLGLDEGYGQGTIVEKIVG